MITVRNHNSVDDEAVVAGTQKLVHPYYSSIIIIYLSFVILRTLQSLKIYLGKNQKEKVIEAIKILKDSMPLWMSVQSLDKDVLKNINLSYKFKSIFLKKCNKFDIYLLH